LNFVGKDLVLDLPITLFRVRVTKSAGDEFPFSLLFYDLFCCPSIAVLLTPKFGIDHQKLIPNWFNKFYFKYWVQVAIWKAIE